MEKNPEIGISKIFKLYDNLKKFEDGVREKVELEARFKGINKVNFERFSKYIDRIYPKNEIMEASYTEFRSYISGKKNCVHRTIHPIDSESFSQSKSVVDKLDIYDMWTTIVVSIETEIYNDVIDTPMITPTNKERRSVYIKRDNEILFRIDTTKCEEKDLYQIELEIYKTDVPLKPTLEELLNIIHNSPKLLRRVMHDTVIKIANSRIETIGSYFSIARKRFQTPKTLQLNQYHSLYNGEYYMTPKIDGERRFLLLLNKQVFSIDLIGQVRLERISSIRYNSSLCSILDCEFLNERYNIIDVVVLEQKFVADDDNPQTRLKMFEEEYIDNSFDIGVKEYLQVKLSPEENNLIIDNWNNNYDMDGIIIVDRKYTGKCFKLKYNTTVDLLYKNGAFTTGDGKTIDGSVTITGDLVEDRINELIVISSKELHFLKVRDDKPYPNSSKVVLDNMSDSIATMDIFKGKGCVIMRKLHNRVKLLMYRMVNINNSVVLDIGSGQGGDLSKWKNVSKVYAVEPNEEANREMLERMSRIRNRSSIKIISSRTENHEYIINNIEENIEVISLFFCLNLFEEDDLIGLYNIINEVASNDCRIIGAYMERKEDSINECYSIETVNKEFYRINFYGTRINQMEKDFDYNIFKYTLASMGFVEVLKGPINYNMDHLSENEKKLTQMYIAFEFRRDVDNCKWCNFPFKAIQVADLTGIVRIDNNGEIFDIVHGKDYHLEQIGSFKKKLSFDEVEMAKIRISIKPV